jgi:hypothetical protein
VKFPNTELEEIFSVPIINKAKGPWSNEGDRIHDPIPSITEKNREQTRKRRLSQNPERSSKRQAKLEESVVNSSVEEMATSMEKEREPKVSKVTGKKLNDVGSGSSAILWANF